MEPIPATSESKQPMVPGPAPAVPARQRLAKGALSLPDIVASTIANIGPAFSVYFGLAAMSAAAGQAFLLCLISAALAIAILSNTVAQFSRVTPSTGSFVTYIGKAFGARAALTTVITITIGYILAIAAVIAVSGDMLRDVLNRYAGINPPWQLMAGLLVVVVGVAIVNGVKISTKVAAICVAVEVAVIIAGSLLALVRYHSQASAAPFSPSHLTGGAGGFGIGFALAIFIYLGWENSAALAEETVSPRRNVPRAMFSSTALMIAIYLLGAYAIITAFNGNITAIGDAPIPFISVIHHVASWLEPVAYIAGISSVLGLLIAATNSQSRLMFNAAREGLLPSRLGLVGRRKRAPWVATTLFLVMAVLIIVFFGLNAQPDVFLGEAATLGTIPIIATYAAANLALPVYWLRYHRETFRVTKHLLLPIVGIASLIYPLWTLVKPGQPAPYDRFGWASLAIVGVSLAAALIAWVRIPGLGSRIGSIIADE